MFDLNILKYTSAYFPVILTPKRGGVFENFKRKKGGSSKIFMQVSRSKKINMLYMHIYII